MKKPLLDLGSFYAVLSIKEFSDMLESKQEILTDLLSPHVIKWLRFEPSDPEYQSSAKGIETFINDKNPDIPLNAYDIELLSILRAVTATEDADFGSRIPNFASNI